MVWTGLNELREMFLKFFDSKGHLRHESASLVPQGDASLLLINSGMAPLKKYFTGELTPPRARMATCQKCIRTPDIESVGITARHGTYFEMLGNFSFGDYFKREAIAWAWEFFVDVLKMDTEKLYITVFLEDDEAWDIWTKEVGVAESHMSRLGRKDNFWEHGKGPCGPCSEIHYDRGEQYGCGAEDCAPGCECDRFMEIWNLVFTQFDSDGEGNYAELDRKNIDTGMGLERLACVMQQVGNLFEVDTVQNIMQHVMEIAGVKYHENEKQDISLRVITDHIRSTAMMISDGVMPSNEGRGYVLRRLLRRAARHGRLLGITEPFLAALAETVIHENQNAYPLLAEKRDFILRVIVTEEENFNRTIEAGMELLAKEINFSTQVDPMLTRQKMLDGFDGLRESIETITNTIAPIVANRTPADDLRAIQGIMKNFSGKIAFMLSDTYGFPIDLTKEILAENDLKVDMEEYNKLVKEQRERSRAARKEAGGWDGEAMPDTKNLPATQFVGYEQDVCEATVLAVFDNVIILDKTPFYAESGGQCGDTGTIGSVTVSATTKTPNGIILHHVEDAEDLQVGDIVCAAIMERRDIRANHTAAHLLQAALRQVLGNHVEQAGQSVTPEGMRFDFTHFAALTKEELRQIELYVNETIWKAVPVETEVLPVEEAKARGAMALFGEKYGDTVRMVSIGDVSKELCGGTHAANTGNLGMFFITSESSIASGVRRIEAVTTKNALRLYHNMKTQIEQVAGTLKANNVNELEARAQALMAQLKDAEKNLAAAQLKLSGYVVQELLHTAVAQDGVKFIEAVIAGGIENLRSACDHIKQSTEPVAAIFHTVTEKGALQMAAAASPEAIKRKAHAGNLVKAAAQAAGGSGGGKPDSAMAGGKDASKLKDALAAGRAALLAMINAK